MVRIWYSVLISEQDFTLLMSALQDLVATAELSTITDGKMEISASQLRQLRTVWATWLRLSERKGPWVAKLAGFREKQWHTKLYACHPQRTQGFRTTLF